MQLLFRGQYQMNQRELLRRCGYGEMVKSSKHPASLKLRRASPSTDKPMSLRDKLQAVGGEVSYVRRMTNGEFPRFHAYLDLKSDGFQINLHLDQKAPTYGEHTAHSGEYDGVPVATEGERLRALIEQMKTI